ncbi:MULTISPECIES: hypothetical protein [unclassified Lysobacter]|uniref:hypothetical protein n=1 Tax=unclassified Lysobacter TaxID=2635362 RepID=UPI001C24D416|nr:hypothetical protein [Lysobacter sp. MMG2]MBU8978058.1 hypothetical protein [Lysobacter sp. MMG2]
MRRIALASCLLLAGAVSAGELAHRATYDAASLGERGIDSVSSLILDYAKTQNLALNASHPPVFLVEGKHQVLTAQEREAALAGAATVELMSDGDAVVVNVRK